MTGPTSCVLAVTSASDVFTLRVHLSRLAVQQAVRFCCSIRNRHSPQALELDVELKVLPLQLLGTLARVLSHADVERRVDGLLGLRERLWLRGRLRDRRRNDDLCLKIPEELVP